MITARLPDDQAASGPLVEGGNGGSSSCSSGRPGITYWPVSQRPKSTSEQRLLQNGRLEGIAALLHTGQRGSAMFLLQSPIGSGQRRVGS